MSRVIFPIMRWWPPNAPRSEQVDLYEEIRASRKTSEWREAIEFWTSRLFVPGIKLGFNYPASYGRYLKVKRAWFVVGYPKGLLPRLEVDIVDVVWHPDARQLEIQFENVVEVLEA